MSSQQYVISTVQAGQTLAAFLRTILPGHSWSQVRRIVEVRRVLIGDEHCFDPARRLSEGETVELLDRPALKSPEREAIVIRHRDEHIIVAEKPSGINTVRHPAEREWSDRRRALSPTLEDLVAREVGQRLRIVHRIDKETSGLVVFARTVQAERGLGRQFHDHTAHRRYWALIPGHIDDRTIRSRLVRDRGDGKRGSTNVPNVGKEAVTHVHALERLSGYSVVECRLETGRTHQIRIHLSELGHPICGEKVYRDRPDESGAPRLALHAAELGFVHPVSREPVNWSMALPSDLVELLDRIRE